MNSNASTDHVRLLLRIRKTLWPEPIRTPAQRFLVDSLGYVQRDDHTPGHWGDDLTPNTHPCDQRCFSR
jgi:hypothetical protein